MLPTARNKLTMGILARLKQQGPPPASKLGFSPMDNTDSTGEDDLGRKSPSGVQAPGSDQMNQDPAAENNQDDSSQDLLQPTYPRKRKPVLQR